MIYYNFVANIPCIVSLPSGGKVRLHAGGTLRVSEQDGQFLNSPSSSDFTSLRLISVERSEEVISQELSSAQILTNTSDEPEDSSIEDSEEHLTIISSKRGRAKSS